MKTLSQFTAIILVTVCAATVAFGQTTPPAPTQAVPKPRPHRYSGKITAVDAKTKTVTIDPDKLVILLTDTTKIIKIRTTAKIEDLTVGEMVTGFDHKDPAGNWVADSLNVGQVRQVLDAPITKTFVPPTPKAGTNNPPTPTQPN